MAQEEKRVFDFALFPKSKTWKSLKVLFYFSSCSKVSYFFSQVVQRLSMAILNFMNSLRILFFSEHLPATASFCNLFTYSLI